MRDNNKYLENSTNVDKAMFYTYYFLHATLATKKKMLTFLIALIGLYSLFSIIWSGFQIFANIIPDDVMFAYITIPLCVINIILVALHFLKFHRYTLIGTRIIMIICFIVLTILLRKDIMLVGLCIGCGLMLLASIYLFYVMRDKSYKGYKDNFSYHYQFKPNMIVTETFIKENRGNVNVPYNFHAVYDFDKYYFIYLTVEQALLVDKNGFFNGDSSDFENMLSARNIKIKRIDFKYAIRNTDNRKESN